MQKTPIALLNWLMNLNTLRPTAIAMLASLFMTLCSFAYAANDAQKAFKDHTVLYSAFNSSFISPEIASTYNIIRGKNRGLINIAVLENNANTNTGGKPALVRGHVANILGQQQTLDFFEVNEGTASYYLASFRFDNKDYLTFKISVQPNPDKPADEISFQRTFYHDQ